jgi:hypothetical protein
VIGKVGRSGSEEGGDRGCSGGKRKGCGRPQEVRGKSEGGARVKETGLLAEVVELDSETARAVDAREKEVEERRLVGQSGGVGK